MRRHELAGLFAGEPPADPPAEVALDRDDTHPRADVRHRLVHGEMCWQLADEEQVAEPRGNGKAARAVQVVELPEIRAIRIEDLHARILAVGHVDAPARIGGDV